jgi:membrane protein involved in colicin uptake
MTKRFFTFFLAIGLASVCAVQAQSPTPGESPAKHRGQKKAETTASTSETTASPAPGESPAGAPKAKRGRKKAEAGTAASPAAAPATSPAAAPKAKGSRKKAETGTSASPSPAKFSLSDMFKPKSSAAASPASVSGAAAKNTSAAAAATAPAPGGGHGLVWVNTDSRVYHREGSRFYGTTKKGKYMSEAEAVKEGNRAAGKGE